MNSRKYQVFISSTYADLVEERKKILDVLLMADCIPAGMEAFVATDLEQFEVIKRVIDLCDYYVLVIGQRYGSVNSETGKSYTEMEYDYAIEKNIPVLVFAIDESVKLEKSKIESNEDKRKKLCDFRDKALHNRLCSIWKNTDELVGQIAVSIMMAKQDIKRPGWQRGADYDEASLRREIMMLQDDNTKLKSELEKANSTIQSFYEQENVAFDNYNVKIGYHYTPMGSHSKRHGSIEVKLPELFKVIATEMMDVSLTETAIGETIRAKYTSISGAMVFWDDEQQIKIILNQLRALNLIYSRWSRTERKLYWGLTEKGIKVRDDMIITKEN